MGGCYYSALICGVWVSEYFHNYSQEYVWFTRLRRLLTATSVLSFCFPLSRAPWLRVSSTATVSVLCLMHFFSLFSADLLDDIKAANEKFMAVFGSGDATAVSQLFTEDCKLMPPGSDVIIGREGITDICMTLC